MKNLLSSFLVLVTVLLLGATVYAQTPTTQLSVRNYNRISLNQVSFDVYIKNTYASPVEFNGGQYMFNFNKAVLNGGTGTLTILSSSLPAALQPKNPSVATTTTPGQLRTAANTPPGAGLGYVLNPGDSVMIVRFQLATSAAVFAYDSLYLTFRRPSTNPYTKIGAYLGVTNTDITSAVSWVDANTLLPVELSAFNAKVSGRDMNIEWTTATEVNTARFEVERAVVKANSSQLDWVKIATVNAAGNSNSPKNYSYSDKRLNTGDYSYRLKMVDNDGTFNYSAAVNASVDKPATFDLSQNYPNPFNPTTKIDFQLPVDASVTLELYAVSGEKVATLLNGQLSAGYNTYNLSSNGLASGMYIYRLVAVGKGVDQKFTSVKKMILMK